MFRCDAGVVVGWPLRGEAFVAVVQANKLRNGKDPTLDGQRDRPRKWRVFVEGEMRAGAQIVVDVAVQDTT
jgi:hypothetical protein